MLCRLGKTRGHNGDDLSYQSWPFTRAVKRARISMTPLVNGEETRKEHSLKVANEIRKALVPTHSCFCGPLESWRSLGHPNKCFQYQADVESLLSCMLVPTLLGTVSGFNAVLAQFQSRSVNRPQSRTDPKT